MSIPAELTSRPQWVGWKTIDGKKVPINPHTGKAASSTNQNTWGSVEDAQTAQATHKLDGIGYVLNGDGIVVIDLDHCLQEDGPTPLAQHLVNRFKSLTEVSPSGTGLHIFVKGKLPNGNISSAHAAYGIEAYEQKRYITWTGSRWPNTPDSIAIRQEALDELPEYLEIAKAAFAISHAESGSGNQVLNDETFRVVRDTTIDVEIVKEILIHAATAGGRRPLAEARGTVESAVKGGNRAASKKILTAQESSGDRQHAEVLEREFSGSARWAAHSGRWMMYKNGKWRPCEEIEMVNTASSALLQHYAEKLAVAKGKSEVQELTSLAREACSVVRVKMALIMLAGKLFTAVDDWDKDNHLLNFKNGTLDMSTMLFREHRAEDLLTKQVDCDYDPDAECPVWKQTLSYVLDAETRGYFKRAMGYSLSGDMSAQAMFVAWGSNGFNGKTTLIEGFARALGPDYAMAVDPNLLAGRDMDLIKMSQVAQMVGIRFVHMSEMAAGQRLNENFVKQLTGGDSIIGKFYHKNTFSFVPVAKLWLRTNDVPHVQSVSPAIWRRLKMIPFEKTVPETARRGMSEVFADFDRERSGILAWALEGWVEYVKAGLQDPVTVREAIREYREESDYVKVFLTETTVMDADQPDWKVTINDLHRRYRQWSSMNNYDREIISSRALAARLRAMGLRVDRGTANAMTVFGMKFAGSAAADYAEEF